MMISAARRTTGVIRANSRLAGARLGLPGTGVSSTAVFRPDPMILHTWRTTTLRRTTPADVRLRTTITLLSTAGLVRGRAPPNDIKRIKTPANESIFEA